MTRKTLTWFPQALAALLLTLGVAGPAAAQSVLIYGPGNSGTAQTHFPPGATVTVASDAVWRSMMAADFAAFDVIWINGGTCDSPPSTIMAAAVETEAIWGSVTNGRAVYTTADHVFHANGGNTGAQRVIQNSVTWLGGGGATATGGATGVWLSWSCLQYRAGNPHGAADFPTAFPGITIANTNTESNLTMTPAHPTLAGVPATGANSLVYGQFCHGQITAQPSSWTPLVTCTSPASPGAHAFMVRELPACTTGPSERFVVDEGSMGMLTLAGVPAGATVQWDLDNNGSFETTGNPVAFDATSLDGPSAQVIGYRVTGAGCRDVTDMARVIIQNVAPTITTTGPTAVMVGVPIGYDADATDPAGAADPLTWSLVSGPAWVSVDPATGVVSGTPPASAVGTTVTIVISVSDGDGGTAEQTITIRVIECRDDGACDDSNVCTADACNRAGVCVNRPLTPGTDCGGGRVCDDGSPPMCVECRTDRDCNDGNECTADACDATGTCTNASSPLGTRCSAGICDGEPVGPMCTVCVDNMTGTDTDAGCTADTPVCDTSGAAPVCVECLSDADCPLEVCDLGSNTCAPCVDTMTGAGIDQGCAAAAPLCVVAGGVNTCVACQNDAAGGATDLGCDADTPVCDTSGAAPVCELCTHIDGASPDDGCADPTELCRVSDADRMCVGCLTDADCPVDGEVCNPSGTCTPGCRMDSDCAGTPATPVCDTAEDVCVECLTDMHCPADEVCSPERVCVDCNGDDDCDGALVCEPTTDTCVECISDRECPEGLVCTSNACVPECRSDMDCPDPSSSVCDAGVCTQCTRDEECDTGEVCAGGTCGPMCTMDAECTTADAPVCDEPEGICVQCTADSECDSGACDEPTRTCVPGCTSSTDCSGVRAECDIAAGICVQCVTDEACGAGSACDMGRGVCVECTSDGQCLTDETCTTAGVCVGCGGDAACTAPAVCDPDLMSCGSGCTTDPDCDNPRLPVCDAGAGMCDECRVTSDCQDSEICTPEGRCQPPCATNADCRGAQVCNPDTGLCVDGCAGDTDCMTPTPVCIDRMCAECRESSDCADGQTCDRATNRCVDGCTDDSECTDPSLPACSSDGVCVVCRPDMAAACTTAPDGTACVVDGAAVRCGCTEDAECADGRMCDPMMMRCVDRSTTGGVSGGALCAIRAGSPNPAPLIPLFASIAAVGLALWRRRR